LALEAARGCEVANIELVRMPPALVIGVRRFRSDSDLQAAAGSQ